MPRKQKQQYNPYASINRYNYNFHQESNEAVEGMVDISKMVVGGAVLIGGMGLLGSMFGGMR